MPANHVGIIGKDGNIIHSTKGDNGVVSEPFDQAMEGRTPARLVIAKPKNFVSADDAEKIKIEHDQKVAEEKEKQAKKSKKKK